MKGSTILLVSLLCLASQTTAQAQTAQLEGTGDLAERTARYWGNLDYRWI